MILQAECVNPTNVRRSSVTSLPSRKSSSASSTQVVGGEGQTRMSRLEEHKMDQKAKQEDKIDPDMIPCEFCGDMQYEETIMRHQVLNLAGAITYISRMNFHIVTPQAP